MTKNIYITESQYQRLLKENANERKRQAKCHEDTLNVVRRHFNNASWLDDVFDHADNPNRMSALDYMVYHFEEDYFHPPRPSKPIIQLEPMIAKIAFGFNYQNDNPDNTKLERLRKMLNMIEVLAKQGKIEINKLPKDSTYEQLDAVYGNMIDNAYEYETQMINALQTRGFNQEYELVEGVDFKTANYYGNHSCPGGKLCYTQGESTWSNYTNNGMNKVYILLRKGWENIPAQRDDNFISPELSYSGYDTYGLSMIFVFVDPDKRLAYCNTRWNHNANYRNDCSVDHALTRLDLSKLAGVKFWDIFKPYSPDELLEMGYIPFDRVQEMLDHGVNPGRIFQIWERPAINGFFKVRLNGKWNFLTKDYKILYPEEWFYSIGTFDKGFVRVKNGEGKWNFLTSNGELLWNGEWFNNIWNFEKGFAKVENQEGKYNYLTSNGELLWKGEWFKGAINFKNGFAAVQNQEYKWNFLTPNGELLWKGEWFNGVEYFENGFAAVQNQEDKWNFLTPNGDLLWKGEWFNYAFNFKEGFARVRNQEDKWNYITSNGELLWKGEWFNGVEYFENGFARVRNQEWAWNFLTSNGEILWKGEWFNDAWDFKNGFARVLNQESKWNFLTSNGEILWEGEWFVYVENNFVNGFTGVQNQEGKWFLLDEYGNLYDENKKLIERGNSSLGRVDESKMKTKNIYITESQYQRLLNEGAVDNFVKNTIANFCSSYYKPYLNTLVTELPEGLRKSCQESGPHAFEICVKNGETLLHYFRYSLMTYFDINQRGPKIYFKGIARIACGELGMFNESHDESSLAKFKQNVMFLFKSPELVGVQFDKDLNGMDYYQFTKLVNGKRREFNARNRANHTNVTGPTDYRVVQINSFEEAAKYGKYTEWCVTHGIGNYNGYTEGGCRFYFCLKKGFENVPKRVTEGCPLDEYGLSMISVLIDMDGEPYLITTRWNHAYDGENNENLKEKKQFEAITNIDWHNTFIPYSHEELRAMGITPFDEVQDMLDSGVSPEEIFSEINDESEGFRAVVLNDNYNFLTRDNQLLWKGRWFYAAGDFENGFARVMNQEEMCNFLTSNGEILWNGEWFDGAGKFNEGFARVKNKEGKWNYLASDGELLWEGEWLNEVLGFKNGFARVRNQEGKYNYLTSNGELLWKGEWFKGAGEFEDGFAIVRNQEGNWFLLDKHGNLYDKNKKLIQSGDSSSGLVNENMIFTKKELNEKYNLENKPNKLKSERAKVNTNPTEKQKKAGNYAMGHINIMGFNITIENPKGSYRKGKDSNGKSWKTYMHNDYGYFTKTKGKDGDAIDVFLGPNLQSAKIYGIDQNVGGKFDETKVMLGFNNAEQAKKAYMSNYNKDWKGFKKITGVDIETFKKWLYDGHRQKKPFAEYVEFENKKYIDESKGYQVFNNKKDFETHLGIL